MEGGTTVVQPPMTAATMIENYIKLRNKLKELKDAYNTRLKPLTDVMEDLEAKLMQELERGELSQLKGISGTAFTQVETSVTVKEWSKTFDFIQAHGHWELLEARVAKGAAVALMEETKQPIPGVNVNRVKVLRVRAA
jgi:hypothetical protein